VCAITVDLLKVDGALIVAKSNSTRIVHGLLVQFGSVFEEFINAEAEREVSEMGKSRLIDSATNHYASLIQMDQYEKKSDRKVYTSVLPLFINRKICGYFKVFSQEPIINNSETMDFFNTLAGQTSLALENRNLIGDLSSTLTELETAYEETIAGWSKALELKDKETKGHSDRVTELAIDLARKAGFPEDKMVDFQRGVKLHDIGKMGIPDAILLKPGKLSDEDWMIMKEHPKYAYDLLSNIPYLKNALEIPYGHHERWDGSGYPQGLKGKDIPLSARIFAIVDVWDALRGVRPYKPAWEVDRVKNYMIENKGVLFDPELVDLFLEIVENEPVLE
jgi:HD-GYP domain-containing protein (c-di-GMP phosphodiesterase class II)